MYSLTRLLLVGCLSVVLASTKQTDGDHACYNTADVITKCKAPAHQCHITKLYGKYGNKASSKGCSELESDPVCLVLQNGRCFNKSDGLFTCCCDGVACNRRALGEVWNSMQHQNLDTACMLTDGCPPAVAETTEEGTTANDLSPFSPLSVMAITASLAVAIVIISIAILAAIVYLKIGKRRQGDDVKLDPANRKELVINNPLEGEATDRCGYIGDAYTATLKPIHLPVVAKEFYPKILDEIDFTAKEWRRHREELMNLRHVNLARVYQIYWPNESDESLMVVYEMVGRCRSLGAYLRERSAANERVLNRIKYGLLAQVAAGMEHLHTTGLYNPYLGARNIIVEEGPNAGDGEVALQIDLDARTGGLPRVKVSDYAMGPVLQRRFAVQFLDSTCPELPVRWMSPETLEGNALNQQTDIWSFGVLCWEVINDGAKPFDGKNNVDAACDVLEGGAPDPAVCQVAKDLLMREFIYYRCFAYTEIGFRPDMKSCKTTLIGFYSGDDNIDNIPPLRMKEEGADDGEDVMERRGKGGVGSAISTATTRSMTWVRKLTTTSRKEDDIEKMAPPPQNRPARRPGASRIGDLKDPTTRLTMTQRDPTGKPSGIAPLDPEPPKNQD